MFFLSGCFKDFIFVFDFQQLYYDVTKCVSLYINSEPLFLQILPAPFFSLF